MAFEDGIPEVVDGAAAFANIAALFQPARDYSYRTFSDFGITDADLTRGMFTGSLWRSLQFERVNLQRSDFDGNQIEDCVFTDVDFSHSDIRSTKFTACRFERCKFDEGLVDDCVFERCTFSRCTYIHAVQRDLRFLASVFEHFTLERSSFIQAQFIDCTLKCGHLADCTLLYVVLTRTQLSECTVNLETMGTIFGLRSADLTSLKFRFLGKDAVPHTQNEIVESLEKLYSGRRWAIQLAVTRLNFGLTSNLKAIDDYLDALSTAAKGLAPVRRDEVRFFAIILETLFSEFRLPFLAVTKTLDALNITSNSLGSQQNETLVSLGARMSSLAANMLKAFHEAAPTSNLVDDRQTQYVLRLTFKNKPELDLITEIENAAAAANLRLARPPVRLSTMTGSYIEILGMTVLSMFSLYTILFLGNGILIQLQQAQARIRQLQKKRTPKKFLVLARQGQQPVPKIFREPLNRLLRYALGLPWIHSDNLGGLDSRNLQAVELESTEEKKTIRKKKR